MWKSRYSWVGQVTLCDPIWHVIGRSDFHKTPTLVSALSKQSKVDIAVHGNHHTATGNHTLYGITQVTCHPAAVTFLHLDQPKLVLDLASTDGCKAEL